MDRPRKARRMELLVARCREQHLPLTTQRRAVLETVLDVDGHPTADEVHTRAVQQLPELSRATVYRTLETLVRLDLLTKVCHPGRSVRFDAHTDLHHHLVCLRCDWIVDIEDERLNRLPLPDTSRSGFAARDYRVQIRGLCRHCQAQEEAP